jgi:hypothetical protein
MNDECKPEFPDVRELVEKLAQHLTPEYLVCVRCRFSPLPLAQEKCPMCDTPNWNVV